MKEHFYKIRRVKRKLLVLSICLSFGFTIVKPKEYKISKNNILSEGSQKIIKKKYTKNVFFFSDSLPCRRKKEKTGDWEILFNGKNTNKWRGANSDTFPSAGWIIKDGSLFLNKKGSGDIITSETFSNFKLVLDFKLTDSANSGVKYFVGKIKNTKTGEIAIGGPEYQIIDDFNHPEVKNHKHDIAATASCYLLYAPKNKRLYPAGQWNHVEIIANGKHVEHWLNGVMVLSYERGSEDFLKRKAATKFKDYEYYGERPAGHILLTDHRDKVYFKNIKIKRVALHVMLHLPVFKWL